MTKHKIQAIGDIKNDINSSFLPTFNEHIHLVSNDIFIGILDVWKHDWAFRVLYKWFHMFKMQIWTQMITISSEKVLQLTKSALFENWVWSFETLNLNFYAK